MFIYFLLYSLVFSSGNAAQSNLNFGSFVQSIYATNINDAIRIKYVPNETGSPVVSSYTPISSEYRNEITFEYDVMFENGFEWVRGGKMPGLRGGDINLATSGCVRPQPAGAWSYRPMWKPDGTVILYIYDQSRIKNNDACGISTASEKGVLKVNQWLNFKIYMKLNSNANLADGVAKLYVDNKLAVERKDIQFRGIYPGATVDHIMFETFYGGHDPSWAPSKTTYAQFKNPKIYNWDLFSSDIIKNNTQAFGSYWKCGKCNSRQFATI